MKRTLTFALGAILLACAVWTQTATAATEAEKLLAIQNGLAHLAAIQNADGSWSYGAYDQAATGAAAFAFMNLKSKWGANAAAYQVVADKAIAYLLLNASTISVSIRNDNVNICPSGSGSCTGVYWYGSGESTYTTGIVGPAIVLYGASIGANVQATGTGPLAGMTWRQIAQGLTNAWAASQSSSIDGSYDGGWRYYIPGNGQSDSSTTQWAVISMMYNETLGVTTPATVKTHLITWLTNPNLFSSGAVCYYPGSTPCDNADTGGWLLAMKWVGFDVTNSRVVSALGFLNSSWTTGANGTWYGNFGHPYAMWASYKGLESMIGLTDNTHITTLLTPTCGGAGHQPASGVCNWAEDYNQWLVANQNPNGSWGGYSYWTDPLSTAFDLGILGVTVIPGTGTPVPTLSEWGLVALGILLAGFAAIGIRKAHARPSE